MHDKWVCESFSDSPSLLKVDLISVGQLTKTIVEKGNTWNEIIGFLLTRTISDADEWMKSKENSETRLNPIPHVTIASRRFWLNVRKDDPV